MRKFYSMLIEGKVFVSFALCYLVAFTFEGLRKIVMVSFGSGDMFYYIYRYLMQDADLSGVFSSLVSFFMLGSMASAFLLPLVFVFFIFCYATVVQAVLHLLSFGFPARFSYTLSIMFSTAALFYFIKIIPFAGGFIFSAVFVYKTAKELARINNFSTFKGVLVLCVPFGFLFAALFLSVFVFGLFGALSFV
ncbi:MAG: hypothetical protein JXA66_01055 [Oligoflexia bacterium]|nr:hypothetical protein [Oligoflexia bacterium]